MKPLPALAAATLGRDARALVESAGGRGMPVGCGAGRTASRMLRNPPADGLGTDRDGSSRPGRANWTCRACSVINIHLRDGNGAGRRDRVAPTASTCLCPRARSSGGCVNCDVQPRKSRRLQGKQEHTFDYCESSQSLTALPRRGCDALPADLRRFLWQNRPDQAETMPRVPPAISMAASARGIIAGATRRPRDSAAPTPDRTWPWKRASPRNCRNARHAEDRGAEAVQTACPCAPRAPTAGHAHRETFDSLALERSMSSVKRKSMTPEGASSTWRIRSIVACPGTSVVIRLAKASSRSFWRITPAASGRATPHRSGRPRSAFPASSC